MTIQQAAIIGSVLGLLARSLLPFLILVWKKKAKLTDFDWLHLKSAIIGTVAGAASGWGVPAYLAQLGIANTSPAFAPLVLLGCAGFVYFVQDNAHEVIKPKE